MGSHTATHGTAESDSPRSGEVGWPAPPNEGEGLGWPGDLTPGGEDVPAQAAPAPDDARTQPDPRGPRRLVGERRAA